MTEKEAIKNIDDVLNSEYHYDESLGYQLTSDDIEWLEKAKEALSIRTPKKPKFYDSKFRQRGKKYGEFVTLERAYDCPHCMGTLWGEDKKRHCDYCGQALDWGMGEEK